MSSKRLFVAVFASGVITLLTLGLVACGGGGASSQPISVALTPSNSKSIDQSQTVAITASIAHDTKGAGVQWTVTGGGTLTAQSTSTATYNTPASVTSPFTATVTATSVTDTTKSATLQIKVSPPPAVTISTLAAATAGTAYSATLTESGGTSPYTWSVTAGSLPAGLSLNASTGAISGTPTGVSNGSVTFQVTDATGMTATQAVTFTVNAPPALAITTNSLPAGTMGTAYSQTAQATGGVPAYKWAVTAGSLPAGLTLNTTTGVISGTPTGKFTGTSNFTLAATDSQTPTAVTKSADLSIAVSAPPLSVMTATLAGATIGTAYSQTLQASGGVPSYSWAVTTGTLPTGLSLNAATGVISGTPSGNFVGTTNFTVTATDSETPTAKTATASLSITTSVAPLSVTTTTLAAGIANSVYAGATLQATGGITPYSWSVTTGGLPAGLTLNAATGAISGTPTAASTSNFTVTVTDSEMPTAKTAAANLSITVNPAVSVTTNSLPAGVIGTAYTATLQAAGGTSPYTWAVTTGSLPAGLSLNASTGVISGTPSGTFVGTTSFTVTVTDNESPTKKTATTSLSIAITAPALSITTVSLAGGSINVSYSQTVQASGGITPYTWAVTTGNLPTGLSLNASTGVISGTPSGTFVGTDNFTVTVGDTETPTSKTASANLSITITVAALSVTTTSLPGGIAGSVYPGATLAASGGITPYSWSVTTGSLPAGLSLNASTGAISGTPTSASNTNFTVTVTDSETPTAKTATANLSIVVTPTLSVTTNSLAAGVIGSSYSQTLQAAGGTSPYTWAVTTGSLPAGLSLNGATGAISGTPSGTFTGTTNFTVTVTDNESPTKKTASANLSISITAPALSVTTTTLPGGSIGTSYSQTLQASGGITPYTWAVTTGSLPTGLSLNASTGVISGTPSGTFVGTDNFTVTVTDAEAPTGKTASANLSITVSVTALSVTTTSSSLPKGYVSSVYAGATLQATGGITPYSWAVTTGSLPAGLSLNASTGAISGTPTSSGTVNFTVTVTDSETLTAKTATANLSIVVNPALSVTTNSLAAGVIGTSYSQTLAAAGGLTPYTWAVTTGSLPSGLSLNASTGAITGTPTGPFVGTTNFTVTVTDSESPTKSSTANLSITISATTLKVTTTSLPTGAVSNSYSATLLASGGVTAYTWAVTTGSLPSGLLLNASTGAITGTPTATGTSNFTVTVTDSETPTHQTATANLSISINSSAPLQITNSPLPNGVVSVSYQNGLLQATGGVQPYTWSITTGSLPAGLTLNASTGAITATPTATGISNFTVKVTDHTQPTNLTQTANLSITIDAGLSITTTSVPNGSINAQYNAAINAAGGLQPYSWSIISGSLPPGLNPSNNNNTLDISGTPTSTGSYTFTVQVTDSENAPVSVNSNFSIVIGTQPQGYTVSGHVTYGGSKTGWTYLQLSANNCGGCNNNQGTSISQATLTAGGAFTIHGVQPGTYNLQAFLDNLGYGAENASNPTGNTGNITVINANVSGVALTLTDPAAVTLSSAPTWSANNGFGAFSGGAILSFKPIQNNNGIEMAASYTLQWSTSSSFATVAGSKSFPANGGNNPWIVNGLTNGTTYYFRAQGVAGSSTSSWSSASSGLTIGAPTGANAVSGKVTFTGTAKGPLYVGFYDQNTGNVYAEQVGSKASPPTSPASYSVNVPSGTFYFFGVVDQANSGLLSGPGQISNANNGGNPPAVVISGPLTNENLTLSSANSQATVMTQVSEQINLGGTSSGYMIGFNVNCMLKLPVAVELATGPQPGAVIPADVATGGFNGNSDRFSYWTSLNGITPNAGDSYTLNVTYSDGTSEVLTVTVSAVLNAFATNLSPQGTGASVTPNFGWTDPANASNYVYQFNLWDQNGNQIWQIPGNHNNSNGFSSSITSITWNVDPTGSGNLPNVSSLNGSSNYNWQITASDANGNSAQVQVTFQTAATPLTLPAAGSVGNAVVSQNFSGAINASGGVGPNYTFTVNGSTVPTNGTPVNLGDGLTASNTGGNTLSLGGTPTSPTTVSFTVAVMDSASNSVGPFTYTITVSAAAPLSIQSTSMPGASEGWAYNSFLQANGGSGNYSWAITSGGVPAGLSLSLVNGNISGTPTAAGTSSFTVQVTDTGTLATATASLSITVTSCTNNANLHGNYAFLLNGWKGTTEAQTTIGSFVADGAGNLSSGIGDTNDQLKGPQGITFTGTYCVGPNNLALINFIPTGGGGGALFAAALDASDGNGHIIRFDGTSTEVSSGLLRKQTTSAFSTGKITGNYAFGFIGVDSGSDNRFGMAGQFNSNGSGTLSGEVDADDANGGGVNTTLSASNFNVASSGRGTATIAFAGQGSLDFVFYVVSSTELLAMSDDANNALIAGQVLQQSGTFTNASLNGVSIVETQALDTNTAPATPDAQAGFLTANGSGSFSVTLDENDGGTMNLGQTSSGTYIVASNGRMTIAVTGENHAPVFYLVAKNQAFVIGTDSKVSFGTLTPQVGSGFTVASLNGNYVGGSQEPVDYNVKTQLVQAHLDGAGNLVASSGQNSSQNCGGSCSGPQSQTFAGTYAAAPGGPDGKFVVSADGFTQVYVYAVSTSQFVLLPVSSADNQSSNPNLTDFHQ